MIRLYMFTEGQTEQTYANTVLKPHFSRYGIQMHKPVLIDHAKKRGRIHRGGGRKYLPMKSDIQRFLKQDRNRDAILTTMIDLYAIPSDFPGLSEAEQLQNDPLKRVQFLERRFADDIDDPRFFPFIQLHEFEAFLFSMPGCFAQWYDDCQREIVELEAVAAQYSSPEMIDEWSTHCTE